MNKILSRKRIGETVEQIFGTHEHQRRKNTMTDIIYGILYSQKLSITWVGRSVAFLLQVSLSIVSSASIAFSATTW